MSIVIILLLQVLKNIFIKFYHFLLLSLWQKTEIDKPDEVETEKEKEEEIVITAKLPQGIYFFTKFILISNILKTYSVTLFL